jgi:hypothetical protein
VLGDLNPTVYAVVFVVFRERDMDEEVNSMVGEIDPWMIRCMKHWPLSRGQGPSRPPDLAQKLG